MSDNSAKKKSKKIPRPYRKALSERKFKRLLVMVSDSSESKKIKTAFPVGDDGKYHFKAPSAKKEATALSGILKKIHKERTGPRTIRLTFLLIIIAVPVLFSILFLDPLAARYLEKGLEDLTETDVCLEGLDIAILSGRISLENLSFASTSDPMKNEVEFNQLLADINISAVFFRRVVFNDLEGGLEFGTVREETAEYPVKKSGGKNDGGGIAASADALSPLLDLIGDSVIPDDSVKLARQLNGEAAGVYESWSENISGDITAAEELSGEIEDFLSEPLPAKTDIAAWAAKVETGRRLAGEIEGKRQTIEDYRSDLNRDAAAAETALQQARTALEKDLAKIESALAFDDEMINGWIAGAIQFYAGPRLAGIYTRIAALSDRTSTGKAQKPEGRGRMKRGRIVVFPVTLPPRFSIRNLKLTGEGIDIRGENVGIDHELAGAASLLELHLEGIDAELVIDGRSSAENLIDGVINAEDWPWDLENEDLGGMVEIGAAFSLSERVDGIFTSGGKVELSDWTGQVNAGELSFINESSPALGFGYSLLVSSGKPDLDIKLDRDSIRSWGGMIADSAVSSGKEAARKALLENVDADLTGLEATIAGWDGERTAVDNLRSQLAADDNELEKQINEWTQNSAGSLPVPEASGLMEGLGSLF